MRVLFDQGTPVPLRHYLEGHEVRTAFEQGWAALENGDLLAAAEREGFGVFVTTDMNLRYQQNLSGRSMAVVVIQNAQWPRLEPRAALVAAAVNTALPGTYVEVEIPAQ
jgi:hypothetical protein